MAKQRFVNVCNDCAFIANYYGPVRPGEPDRDCDIFFHIPSHLIFRFDNDESNFSSFSLNEIKTALSPALHFLGDYIK